jgi:hypothetical protein
LVGPAHRRGNGTAAVSSEQRDRAALENGRGGQFVRTGRGKVEIVAGVAMPCMRSRCETMPDVWALAQGEEELGF